MKKVNFSILFSLLFAFNCFAQNTNTTTFGEIEATDPMYTAIGADNEFVHKTNTIKINDDIKELGSNPEFIIQSSEPQVQANWTENDETKVSFIQNKPELADIATSGSFNNLVDKPTTITGYGITDAYTKTDIETRLTTNAWKKDVGEATISLFTVIGTVTNTPKFNTFNANAKSAKNIGIPIPEVRAGDNITVSPHYEAGANYITVSAASQVNANWNETNVESKAYIQNKPNLSAVATSGSYNDLTDLPTISNPLSVNQPMTVLTQEDDLLIDFDNSNCQMFVQTNEASGTYIISLPNSESSNFSKITIYAQENPNDNFRFDFSSTNLVNLPEEGEWMTYNTNSMWAFEFVSMPGMETWILVNAKVLYDY